jgi:DNA mismatch endonuclease, patch repair protein
MRGSPRRPLLLDHATSARLGRIRQKDTSVERVVRSVLHKAGLRFRKRNRDLPGSPDVANRARSWAVFVHGCFWHHHADCVRATVPKRNRAFWLNKFRANQERDHRCQQALRTLGYRCVVVWECALKRSPEQVAARLVAALTRPIRKADGSLAGVAALSGSALAVRSVSGGRRRGGRIDSVAPTAASRWRRRRG